MRETKTEILLSVLKRRKNGISSLEAMRYAGTRAAARLNDLKRQGHTIMSLPIRIKGINCRNWILVQD